MNQEVFRTMLVKSAIQPVASGLCSQLADPGGSNMFNTPVGDGNDIIYYMSTGYINKTFSDILPLDILTETDVTRVSPGMPEVVSTLSNNTVSETEVRQIFDQTVIVEESYEKLLSVLQLQLM